MRVGLRAAKVTLVLLERPAVGPARAGQNDGNGYKKDSEYRLRRDGEGVLAANHVACEQKRQRATLLVVGMGTTLLIGTGG